MGCYGDGGACFTNDDEINHKIRSIKSHGGVKRFHHHYIGMNSRLDTIQAAVLQVKMKYLDECLKRRDEVAKTYIEKLKDIESIRLPVIKEGCTHVWAQFSILTENKETRDRFYTGMREQNINVAIYYPAPLHTQKCFEYLGYSVGDSLRVTERVCDTIINLPCYAEITDAEINRVCEVFQGLLNESL